MVIYKAFKKGLICRGYQFQMGMNVTDKANCAQNGFHGATNPLDCFRHYPPKYGNEDEYYMCEALGDVDEDDADTKVSCTHLNIVRKLSMFDMATCVLLYCRKNPKEKLKEMNNDVVKYVEGNANVYGPGIAISRGTEPGAAGPVGAILGFVLTDIMGEVRNVRVCIVDGITILPNRLYKWNGGEIIEAEGN